MTEFPVGLIDVSKSPVGLLDVAKSPVGLLDRPLTGGEAHGMLGVWAMWVVRVGEDDGELRPWHWNPKATGLPAGSKLAEEAPMAFWHRYAYLPPASLLD